MAKLLGNCFICQRTIRDHELNTEQAFFHEKWPDSHLACASHTGIREDYFEKVIREHERKRIDYGSPVSR